MWLNIRLLLRILFWPPLAVAAYGIVLGHNHLHVGYGLFLFIETVLLPMIDLAAKKCVPCNSKDLQAMTEESANDLLSKLNRSWKVKSFTKGLELFKLVGNVAEAEGHHPDLHLVGWNNITIEIWTHAVGGLTENDFILAAKINGLNLHHLLRKKAAA
ncbi:hypothetical protein Peur_061268 [Populus x canadensis]